uniref:Cytochrome c oxidase copper chaperone n=1 Tax=Arion vulgaris TaxID=1028688 RepID=A0A0B6ZG75_9EUPU
MPVGKDLSGTEASDASKTQEKPKLRPCCACPETKKARDECVIQNGEEKCGDLIEKHKQCMRDLGFNI